MEKIKSFIESEKGKDILTVVIIVLVGLGSFELGRLSKQNTSSGIKIEYLGQNQEASAVSALEVLSPAAQNSGKNFFASNRGTKYYPLGCSAGNSIKQENRVYFATGAEAEQSGYSLSRACE